MVLYLIKLRTLLIIFHLIKPIIPGGTMGDPILHIVRGHHVIQGIHLLMKIAHVHLTVIDHLVRAPKLERRELHRHIVENDGGLLLYPITDLLYGSLDNLFMIEWQARKLVDRAPTDRVGFIGRTRLPAILALGEISDREQPPDLHLGSRLQPHHVEPVRGTGGGTDTTELFPFDAPQARPIIQYPIGGVI